MSLIDHKYGLDIEVPGAAILSSFGFNTMALWQDCIGLAIFHRKFMDAYFVPSFYKMILGKPVTLADLEAVDNDLHRSLVWMLSVFHAILLC